MKNIILVSLIGVLSLFVGIAVANALVFIPAQVAPSGVFVSVPDVAVNKSPVLNNIQPGTLERAIFIHYANGKPPSKAKTPTCYKLMGIKWASLPINYVVGWDVESKVSGAVSRGNETWDAATSRELFSNNYSMSTSTDWDDDYPDGKNEYSMGDYPQDGVIAVTVVWRGVPIGGRGRAIIEFDVMFDTDFSWGDATSPKTPNVMDLQNIAVHESGHGVGLADIYTSSCSDVTMYGYSGYGEIIKRTLEQADITGLLKLYGN